MIHRMKNYLLYKDATCLMFSECCFLELVARPSSIRTLLLSGFVVLSSILYGSVLLSVVFIGLLSDLNASF